LAVISGYMDLTADELRRYSRHLILPEVGLLGQKKLRSTSVLCIGAGGLGSPILMYLAAAGIGRIGIVDFDSVEASNLQRQVIHAEATVGTTKTSSARDRIQQLNPGVEVEIHNTRLTAANALHILRPYEIVVDGTDNFPTRYLTNDACVLLGKPNVYGSIFRFEGQASVLAPHLGAPCYRCLYPEPPPAGTVPSCAEGGVLGVLPGIIGTIQATEILKLAIGTGKPLLGRMLLCDALEMRFREIKLRRDPHCPICGETPTIRELIDYDAFCGVKQERNSMHPDEVSVQDMKNALEDPSLGVTVIDVREPDEYQIAAVKGAQLLPLSTLPLRYRELDPAKTYYLHCKMGGRSMKALEFLRGQGFKNLKSVAGGITAWSDQVDPSVPKY
jgi:sulfur-carrier protein adenylyltransferase/sulfurtransferase